MLYETSESRACGLMESLEKALDFFTNRLPENLSDKIKKEKFYAEYELALNRIKYETLKQIPLKPDILKAKYKSRGDIYSCGKCGHSLWIHNNYCPSCGTKIEWDSPRCLTKYYTKGTSKL